MSTSKPKKIAGTKPGATHFVGPGGLSAQEFARWYKTLSMTSWDDLDMEAVARLADAVVSVERSGSTLYVMGNGGSAASASHIACDFSKTAAVRGRRPLKCISLADNAAFITAVGNDIAFEEIFSRQLENVLEKGDMVLLVTGSGNSQNMIRAARLARSRGAVTAALLGFDGGQLMKMVDIPVLVASKQYGIIEDLHMAICHTITFYLKQRR